MILNQFTSHPYWNGKLYLPFIQSEVTTHIHNNELQFQHHGINYSAKLNQDIRVSHDGAVFIKLEQRQKYRLARRAIGLPSSMTVYFSGKKHGVLIPRDIELYENWSKHAKPKNIQQAFQAAGI